MHLDTFGGDGEMADEAEVIFWDGSGILLEGLGAPQINGLAREGEGVRAATKEKRTYAKEGGNREHVRVVVDLGERPDVVEIKLMDNGELHLDREVVPGGERRHRSGGESEARDADWVAGGCGGSRRLG